MAESRMIRRGLIDSDRVNSLGWMEQNLFFRLLLAADDFGLFDARPAYLRSQLYGMCLDRVREADLQRGLAACEEAGLVRLYNAGGKPYLMIGRYGQRSKSRPKFPLPPGVALQAVRCGRSTEWALVPEDGENPPQLDATRCDPPRPAADDGDPLRSAALVGVGDVYGDEDGGGQRNKAVGGSTPSLPPPLEEVTRAMGGLMLAPLTGKVMEECATRFIDACEASGWCDGHGLPLRDWRAAARNWARRYADRLLKDGRNTRNRRDCNNADDYR